MADWFASFEREALAILGVSRLLTPEEYRLVAGWHAGGVSLGLVLEVMQDVTARKVERDGERPRGLRYFARAVDQAWRHRRCLQAGGERAEPAPFEARPRLERLVAALPEQYRDPWGARILAAESEDPEAVEGHLQEISDELLTSVYTALPADEQRQLEEEVKAALGPLRGRLAPAAVGQTSTYIRRKLLRERYGIPRLSLFSAEAEGDGDA